jgi:hypothetical protein
MACQDLNAGRQLDANYLRAGYISQERISASGK